MRNLVLVFLLTAIAHAEGLRMGVAAVDITPAPGSPMAGYYDNRAATGTHDPLHVNAMIIEQDGVKVAMAACDVVSFPREISEEARRIVQEKIGLAPDHIMISATHSHTGPVILTEFSRYTLQGEQKRIAEEYTAALPGKIAEAIVQANDSLQPVQMRAAIGEEKTLGFNRRFFMTDGTVGWNPGKLNPKIVRPAGPVDRAVPVLYFESPDEKKPLAAYVNFGVHLDTTGGLMFSADYRYNLGKILQSVKGKDFFTLFTIGAAGNVNHIDVSRKEPQKGFDEASRIGAVLAGVVVATMQRAPVVNVSSIRVSDKILKIDVPPCSKEELAWAQRTEDTFGKPNAAPFLDLVKAGRILGVDSLHGKPLEAEVQVFTFGDQVAIVSFPGELFAEFGLDLKEDSPFPITIVAELADGGLGYIPNRIAYTEGNYEPTSAKLPVGSGELMLDSALEQLYALVPKQ